MNKIRVTDQFRKKSPVWEGGHGPSCEDWGVTPLEWLPRVPPLGGVSLLPPRPSLLQRCTTTPGAQRPSSQLRNF